MYPTRMCAAFAAFVCLAAPASAASLTLTDIDAVWSSTSPTVDGIGGSEIRWGTPLNGSQSGYNFASSPTPFSVEDQTEFTIGTFSHENFAITGTSLESAELSVTFSVVGAAEPITSTFSFLHEETENGPAVCRDRNPNGVGVNASGCADRVTATLNVAQSEVFTIGGVGYILDILGFKKDGVDLSTFWTEENKSNSADLIAVFSTDVEQPVPAVPTPAGGALLLSLLAVGYAARKRA